MDQNLYAWRGLSFQVPAALADQTVVTLVDDAQKPSFNLTVTTDALDEQALEAYVDVQVADLKSSLPRFTLTSRKAQEVAGRPAVLLEHEARTGDGKPVRQRQAYVKHDDRVVIVTATSAPEAESKAGAAFDLALSTLALPR